MVVVVVELLWDVVRVQIAAAAAPPAQSYTRTHTHTHVKCRATFQNAPGEQFSCNGKIGKYVLLRAELAAA